mmetsp:Transcript_27410/g.65175  ORF Transcript_27410/g.65175 Transcript_27410/m.65175 type:complete len:218 (+) Transcript_27410:1008-1661(+)
MGKGAGVVSLLPDEAGDQPRQRPLLQLPVHARPEGGQDGFEGTRGGVDRRVRRGAQHRLGLHRGIFRFDTRQESGAGHEVPRTALGRDKPRQGLGRVPAPQRVPEPRAGARRAGTTRGRVGRGGARELRPVERRDQRGRPRQHPAGGALRGVHEEGRRAPQGAAADRRGAHRRRLERDAPGVLAPDGHRDRSGGQAAQVRVHAAVVAASDAAGHEPR